MCLYVCEWPEHLTRRSYGPLGPVPPRTAEAKCSEGACDAAFSSRDQAYRRATRDRSLCIWRWCRYCFICGFC